MKPKHHQKDASESNRGILFLNSKENLEKGEGIRDHSLKQEVQFPDQNPAFLSSINRKRIFSKEVAKKIKRRSGA